jgi:hypothetical protein
MNAGFFLVGRNMKLDYFLATSELGAIEINKVGFFVISGTAERREILNALDRLFGSY